MGQGYLFKLIQIKFITKYNYECISYQTSFHMYFVINKNWINGWNKFESKKEFTIWKLMYTLKNSFFFTGTVTLTWMVSETNLLSHKSNLLYTWTFFNNGTIKVKKNKGEQSLPSYGLHLMARDLKLNNKSCLMHNDDGISWENNRNG